MEINLSGGGGAGFYAKFQKILEFAFIEDDCIRVVTGCFKDNIPTQRVMVKAGFRQEADKPQSMWLDGQMRDRLEFAINRDEFNKMK